MVLLLSYIVYTYLTRNTNSYQIATPGPKKKIRFQRIKSLIHKSFKIYKNLNPKEKRIITHSIKHEHYLKRTDFISMYSSHIIFFTTLPYRHVHIRQVRKIVSERLNKCPSYKISKSNREKKLFAGLLKNMHNIYN